MAVRSFYWGISCLDFGHVTRLAMVTRGSVSLPSRPHPSARCYCGSHFESPGGIAAYDADTHETVADGELRRSWVDTPSSVERTVTRVERLADRRLSARTQEIGERLTLVAGQATAGHMERPLRSERQKRARNRPVVAPPDVMATVSPERTSAR